MKTHGIIRILMLSLLIAGLGTVYGQRQMEVPGDNFSLEGALELFKKSTSPRDFEKMLNDANTKVNNLDLNGDGYIDYIRVIDMKEGNTHVFILQAVVSEFENQDIAVITLEKLANGKAVLQITGDEDIYGVETIIEPTKEVYANAGTSSTRLVVNVWSWPSVRYIYGPYYSAWVSPWGWNYRPYWWHTWRPIAYYDFYPYWRPYRHHYSVCHTHRVVYAHRIYRPHRTTSVIVHKKHNDRIVRYRSTRLDNKGRYRSNSDRNSDRRINTSVQYDSNGRIRQSTRRSSTSRLLNNTRNGRQDAEEYRSSSRTQDNFSSRSRTSSGIGVGSNNTLERSATIRRNAQSDRSSGTANRSIGTSQRQGSTSKMDRSSSTQRSKTPQYGQGSKAKPSPGRSYSGSMGSTQRSSKNTNIQRSNGRSSSSSDIRRSTESSNVKRSSGNSNIKRSSGSSSIQRSSGNSNARRSSGSSSINRSSGSSKVQRSSGSSSVQRSSGKTSGNSGSSRSSSSSKSSRGRH